MKLKIADISKTYPGSIKALKKISLEITSGIYGLLLHFFKLIPARLLSMKLIFFINQMMFAEFWDIYPRNSVSIQILPQRK
ncbi:hypothetical protein K8T06_09160 [bacterium]|nr:hypothetical protein [bacterium]